MVAVVLVRCLAAALLWHCSAGLRYGTWTHPMHVVALCVDLVCRAQFCGVLSSIETQHQQPVLLCVICWKTVI